MAHGDNGVLVAARGLALVPSPVRELPVADVDALHIAQARVETKVDHVLERLSGLAEALVARTLELQTLRDRVLVLEERLRSKLDAETKAVENARWDNIERWLVRIGAAVGVVGASANAAGLF